jgi:hypothetical protein
VPSGHVVGAAFFAQTTWQFETSVQVTWQSPAQSASQSEALVQVITLPGPAETAHVVESWQTNWQLSPQIVAHDGRLKHVMLQSFPHDDVQALASWHV